MLKKQQWIVVAAAAVLLFSLYIFGNFSPSHKEHTHSEENTESKSFSINNFIQNQKKDLTPSQSAYLTKLEDALTRGDLVNQKIINYQQLAAFWRDSARNFLPYIYFAGEKAKLENSEKNLNFAAHSLLEELRGVSNPELKTWMAEEANDLFARSLKLNPSNDSTIIGLGSTFFFGAQGAPMEGILKIRAIAEKNPENEFAQFMLGYGGLISGQNEKAIERFTKVIELNPHNTEAVFLLAELYEKSDKKEDAIKWYEKGMKEVNNPEVLKAIKEKINSLK